MTPTKRKRLKRRRAKHRKYKAKLKAIVLEAKHTVQGWLYQLHQSGYLDDFRPWDIRQIEAHYQAIKALDHMRDMCLYPIKLQVEGVELDNRGVPTIQWS